MSSLSLLSDLVVTGRIYFKISFKIQLLSNTKLVLQYSLNRLAASSQLQRTGRNFFECGAVP